ncbi:unnamed protein product, partial [Didymodactylos carnosus]
RRDEMKKKHEQLGLLDTVESTTKKRTVQFKNHTVEVAEIDDQLITNTGLFMGNSSAVACNDSTPDVQNDEGKKVKTKKKHPLSKKMSILQNMKATSKSLKSSGGIHHRKHKKRNSNTAKHTSNNKRTKINKK